MIKYWLIKENSFSFRYFFKEAIITVSRLNKKTYFILNYIDKDNDNKFIYH